MGMGEAGYPGSEVNPVYCQTRTEMVDKNLLKRNRVVSFFNNGAIADQLKILDAQVLDKLNEINGNSLIITSPGSGEGKTLTSINLAVSFSQKVDKTVMLIDADLRAPSIHNVLGINVNKGLSDFLLGEAAIPELLINPGIAKMVFLPGGRPIENSTSLLGSPKMKMFVDEIKTKYQDRLIIFDSPSILSSADTLVFSSFVDGIILVAEAEKTTAKDIGKAVELLKDKPLIGTVFNKAL